MSKEAGGPAEEEAVVEAFLRFLDRDIAAHPERLRPISPDLYERLLAVSEGVTVSPDDPIEGPVAL
jgi:antitoxin PrlF